ncbi:MAG: hypothetical protein ABI467_29310 [Kofleriaceae bacterium]
MLGPWSRPADRSRRILAMTRVIAAALLLAVLACGKHATPPPAKPTPLALAGDAGQVIVTLTPEDTLTDATGTAIGQVDWKPPVVTVGTTRETLAYDVEGAGISLVTTMGRFHVEVDAAMQLRVDDKPAGTLSGFARTKEGWQRLAALVLAIPMLPTPPERSRAAPPAPPPSDNVAPPPPPPPPVRP